MRAHTQATGACPISLSLEPKRQQPGASPAKKKIFLLSRSWKAASMRPGRAGQVSRTQNGPSRVPAPLADFFQYCLGRERESRCLGGLGREGSPCLAGLLSLTSPRSSGVRRREEGMQPSARGAVLGSPPLPHRAGPRPAPQASAPPHVPALEEVQLLLDLSEGVVALDMAGVAGGARGRARLRGSGAVLVRGGGLAGDAGAWRGGGGPGAGT